MGNNKELSDLELIQELQKGHQWAFKALYDRYWLSVYQIAYQKLGGQDIAEQIVQQTFLELWTLRESVQSSSIESFFSDSVRWQAIDFMVQLNTSDVSS